MRFFEPKKGEETRNLLPRNAPREEAEVLPQDWKAKAWPILMGQGASIMLCISGVFAIYMGQFGLASASLQNSAAYLTVGFVFMPWNAIWPSDLAEGFKGMAKARGWKYFLIAIFDSQGNYLINLGYKYTSLTSVQLLNCCSIPSVLVLSLLFLKTRYTRLHYTGIVISVLGVVCLILADMNTVFSGAVSSDPVYGDLLTLGGTVIFGFSVVSQEFFVKNFGPYEFLGFVGFFSFVLSVIQTLIFDDLTAFEWTWMSMSSLVGYAVAKFWFYVIIAHLMIQSNSVAITLFILSSGFYSVLVGLLGFGYTFCTFSWIYLVSFAVVMAGIVIYSVQPPVQKPQRESLGPLREDM